MSDDTQNREVDFDKQIDAIRATPPPPSPAVADRNYHPGGVGMLELSAKTVAG